MSNSKKILGLDLGTNSIGWAIVTRTDNIDDSNGKREVKEHYDLEDKGVVIFSEGVKIEKGNESSKAAERTGFRSARRIKFRRKLRKYETLKVLVENNMCPLTIDELKGWRSSTDDDTGKRLTFKKYPSSDAFRLWLLTDNEGDKEQRRQQKKNPYYLRNKALDAKLTNEELGRVMYHFAQRRGFLSNRLDSNDTTVLESAIPSIQKGIDLAIDLTGLIEDLDRLFEEYDFTEEENKDIKKLKGSFDGIIKNNKADLSLAELKERLSKRLNRKENLGAVKQGIADLSEKIAAENCRTMGEYFYRCFKEGKKVRKQYTAREEHYLEEFKAICKAQQISDELREKLERAIFYQRPLKSQKGTVGKCSFEPAKPRCPVSHPDFEEFRMYAFLNNVKVQRVGEDEHLRFLNEDEREKVKEKFYRKTPNFKFEDIAKALSGRGERYAFYKAEDAKHANLLFNFQMNATVSGCPISTALKDVLGDDWKAAQIAYEAKDGKGNAVQRRVDYHDLWHVLFTFDSFDHLYAFATEKLGLSEKKASAFARTRIKKDYAALSLKAIRNILPYLREGLIYSHAVFMANLHSIIDPDKWKGNEDYLRSEIRTIINNDSEDNRRVNIVNDLMHAFKVNYSNHYSSYELDDTDRADVLKKVKEVYGVKALGEMDEDRQKEILTDVEARYLQCLRSGKFLPKKRLDEKVLDLIKDNHLCSDRRRLDNLYHPSDIDAYPKAGRAADGRVYLGSPMTNSVRNPMAMRALHQLRKLVNELISEGAIDEDTVINIELARELNDANKRKAIQKWQKQLEAEKETNAKEIVKLFEALGKTVTANEDDLLKFKLWNEQNRRCVYTGEPISISDFIGPSPKFDIEHTLPRSISEDNSDMNKTLCAMHYNREVKKNRIPYELDGDYDDILSRVKPWKEKYEALAKQMEDTTKRVKAASTKEAKDAQIEKRHLIRLEHDYWKGKYERFTMKEVKSGFKNSQKVDIGIISKLSRAYLNSVFPKVYSVKGSMVAEFRKAWGLVDYEKNEDGSIKLDQVHGLPIPKDKDRSNHAHHCQDAVVIACMSKQKYDLLAHAWGLEEKGNVKAARKELENAKPWKRFTEDARNIPSEILVYHHTPDHVGKLSKKKWRKRGKVERNKKTGEVIYLQGDAARGSLHKDTFYGAILRDSVDKKTGELITDPKGESVQEVKYVVRKELASVDDANLKNIVDDRVREIVTEARKVEKELQKEISELKKQRTKAEAEEEAAIDARINALKQRIDNDLYVIPPKQGKNAYTPIKKVRMFQPTVTDPIHLKPHTHPSRHPHKANYHVMNDENYMMAIYEGVDKKGKVKRTSMAFNMLDIAQGNRPETQLNGLFLKAQVRKGDAVLFYENNPDELKSLSINELQNRFYQIVKFDKNGRLFFRPHGEARSASDLMEKYDMDVNSPHEQVRLTSAAWNFIVFGQGFELSRSGKVKFTY